MITDTNLNLLHATVMYPCIAPEPQWLQLDHTSSEPQKGSTGTPTRGERDGPYVYIGLRQFCQNLREHPHGCKALGKMQRNQLFTLFSNKLVL